jgi:hypothetical protein
MFITAINHLRHLRGLDPEAGEMLEMFTGLTELTSDTAIENWADKLTKQNPRSLQK